ncbi:hypothetical protein Q4S45_19355 [Massilia sp. R2A-15]|uniref:hypothetical protein n=1 Tax=Massilia sp. R2A-15 TaxID=3064278 RepID=UPI0027342CC3|nr:hypothetical protein [Massilia sp. R2A-15]WLI88840.1 hypothetical protein Q4S45_19355 [Massilia sp. R2A-15]
MISTAALRGAFIAAVFGVAVTAHADSFTSSASSAGSASIGSISDSFGASSNSSSGDNKRADGRYRLTDIGDAPGRAGVARLTMQGDDPQQRIVLDLPKAVVQQQGFVRGDYVQAKNRDYGMEFARDDTRTAFYLVLADEWYNELAARKVTI